MDSQTGGRQKRLIVKRFAIAGRFARLQRVVHRLRQSDYFLWASIGFLTVLLILTLISLLAPQTIRFSYAAGTSCTSSLKLFPSWSQDHNAGAFALHRPVAWSIGHTPIFTTKVCATPVMAPTASATVSGSEHWLFFAKPLRVATGAYPVMSSANDFGIHPIPLARPANFRLSAADKTFGYAIMANDAQAPCVAQGVDLACNLAPLKLGYGADYQASVGRTFHGKVVAAVVTKQIQTISATKITQSSIAAGTMVYDQPQQVTLQTDKPLGTVSDVTLGVKNGSPLAVTTTFSGSTITVKFASALPRSADLDLHIGAVTATDTSALEAPYDLAFKTSGGPKVTGMSVGTNDVPIDASLTLSFDQALLASQDDTPAVTVSVNGNKQNATVKVSGSKLLIKPAANFPLCAQVTVQLTNTLQNIYGVGGNSNWSYKFRARCYTTFSIGTSVLGRPMTAYQFGSGSSLVLYIGATHGNESNTAAMLNDWIAALKASPDKVPANRTIVVIPQINPDGVAANTRINAHNIDLNRNFPSNNWQQTVTEPGGASTNDGGPSPLSEPESQALAAYVQRVHPRFVLTYHSAAGVVEANDAGDSDSLAATYASKAKYQAIPTYAIGNTFDYSTTGAFEDWLHDKLGWPAFVVELTSKTADEFSRNQAAMWYMTQITP